MQSSVYLVAKHVIQRNEHLYNILHRLRVYNTPNAPYIATWLRYVEWIQSAQELII